MEFHDLLPTPPAIQPSAQFNLSYDSTTENFAIKKETRHSRVRDFCSWMQAWNLFFQAAIHYATYPLAHLLSYQNRITDYVRKYPFSNVLSFDRAARNRIALNKDISFHDHDEDSFSAFLPNQQLPQCFECRMPGHYSNTCPEKNNIKPTTPYYSRNYNHPKEYQANQKQQATRFRPQHQQQNSQPASPLNNTSTPPHVTAKTYYPTSNTTCRYYNSLQKCVINNCRFTHACSQCKQSHPVHRCPNKSQYKPRF